MTLLNAILQGVLLGGLYALFAAGLSLMFGVMRIVNLAHGDLAVVAAFVALLVVDELTISLLVALLVVVPVMASTGFIVQRLMLQRALSEGPLTALLLTFGLAVVIQNLLQVGFTADQRRLHFGAIETSSIRLTEDLAVGGYPLAVFGVAVALLGALSLFLTRTSPGRLIRATADDPQTVRLVGVDPKRVYALTAALAFGTIAVAGVLSSVQTNFSPVSGPTLLIFAFEAVIIGGLGNLWGTLIGGIVLAVAQNVGAWIEPAQQILAGHLVFLLVLAFRPRGLFPRGVYA